MTDCPPAPPQAGCYPLPNPCDVYAQLENEIVRRTVGGAITSNRVGEESFQFQHVGLDELRSLRDEYRRRCMDIGGCVQPTGRKLRANVCFVFGDHRCALCGSTKCGCGA